MSFKLEKAKHDSLSLILDTWGNFCSINIVGNSAFNNLTDLDLEQNRITAVPDTIALLPNLIRLNLNFNDIKRVSPAIGSLASLKYLGLSNNLNLKFLPTTLCRLTNLKYLKLHTTALHKELALNSNTRVATYRNLLKINLYFGTPCRRACYTLLLIFRKLGVPRDLTRDIVKRFVLPLKDYETKIWFK